MEGTMKPYLLVLACWSAALFLSIIYIKTWTDSQSTSGDIVLSLPPFCDFFVVRRGSEFAFLREQGGWTVGLASGKVVSGALFTKGDQLVSVDGQFDLNVRVQGSVTSWPAAMRRFEEECDP